MTKSIPKYIEVTGIVDAPLEHVWDDDEPESNYDEEVPILEARISEMSDRATVALSTGLAEWVAWRMSKHSDDRMLFNYTEAIWAAIVDWHYIEPEDNPEENLPWADWKGPVRGPKCAVASILSEIVDCAMDEEPASPETVYLANVVAHVLPDIKPFRLWRNGVIDRLTMLYPVNDDEPTGVPVPKEVLDLSFDFKPEMSNKLLDSYVRCLVYKKNSYLRSPQQMRKAGFKGTPYQLF